MDCWALLTSDENLRASYRRARRELEVLEGLVDHEEFAEWENDLDKHLDRVRRLLLKTCDGVPCNLTPVPKGEGKARAYYSIPLEYQVGWLAIVGAIGPLLDKRMPNWSFGYRLHRPRIRTSEGNWPWDEHTTSSEETYLSFARSWKPFRRYANLTLKRFLGDEKHSDDPAEAQIQRLEQELSADGIIPEPQQKLDLDLRTKQFPYFAKSWPLRIEPRVWFARLDIENFFPSINRSQLPDLLMKELTGLRGFDNSAQWHALFTCWLNFVENLSELKADQLKKQRIENGGLPVGLVASGFLANVFMLSFDREVERLLRQKFLGRVAVLRYVDDFIVLAGSQAELADWLKDFIAISHEYGLKLKREKVRPEELCAVVTKLSKTKSWIPNKQNLKKLLKTDFGKWQEQGTVTCFDRKQFISTTLQRMSFRAAEDPEMLDESELQYRFLDLLDLASAGTTNAEVPPETLHAFSAGQLQRTPLCSPAPFLSTTSSTDHIDRPLVSDPHLVQERIRQRGMLAVRQLLTAVTSAPHKHKLIGRCVQVATELAQFLPTDSPDYAPLRDSFQNFLQLLSGTQRKAAPLTWHLGEKRFRSLRPALLSFLRMRFWNAVSDELIHALRGLRLLPETETTEDSKRLIPHRAERLKRALTWLQTQANWLNRAVSTPDRKRVGFLAKMEADARKRWLQLETLTRIHLSAHGSLPPIKRASPTPPQLVEYGQWLLSWSEPEQRGHLADQARHALETWVISSLRDQTPWTPGEHRLISAWLLQDPQRRLGAGQILERLINEQARWPTNTARHSPYSCKWFRELLWDYAALPNRKTYFDTIKGLTLQRLNGSSIRKFVSDIDRQVGPDQSSAQNEENRLCSLQYLMESEIWGTGRLRDRRQQITRDAPEALRVFLLLSLLKWIQSKADPGMCISPDNLFIQYGEFRAARDQIEKGQVPEESLEFDYRLVLKDRFFEVDRTEPDMDKPVVAGLVGIQLLAGTRALDHVLKRRPRRQIDAQDVLRAFEDAPAVSRNVVGIVAALCMFPRWRRVRTNRPIVETYTNLLGVRPLQSLKDAVSATKGAFQELFDNCTQRDGKATYLIEPGIGQGIEDENDPLPDWLKVGLIQPNLDLTAESTWVPSPKQLRMSEDFAELQAWPAIWHGLRAVRAGMRAANESMNASSPPAVIVIPELMVPRRRVTHLKRYAQRENMIIIAGVEYRSAAGWVRNEAVVIIPAEDRTQTASARCFWIGKRYPAPHELDELKNHDGLCFVTSQDLTAIDTKQTGKFGVGVCYDLYAVQTLVGFQRKIIHLFVAAYNRDIQTFDSLGDAAMRLLFCNVVIANGGTYGGSIAVSPYYDPHKREVLRIRGQEVDAAENFRLPLQPLRVAQRGEETPGPRRTGHKHERRFKSPPADWSK